jgi:VanZ family protein
MFNMRYLLFWKPAAWLAVIVFLSLMPSNRMPGISLFPHADKVAHAFFYFIMAVLLMRPLSRFYPMGKYLLAVAFCLVTGILVEIMQEHLVASRSGNLADGLANLSGASVGVLVWHNLIKGYCWEKIL